MKREIKIELDENDYCFWVSFIELVGNPQMRIVNVLAKQKFICMGDGTNNAIQNFLEKGIIQ